MISSNSHSAPSLLRNSVNGATTGALAPGHLTLTMEPERVVEPAVAWLDMMLKGSATAAQMFAGNCCTLCDGTAFPSMWAQSAGVATGSQLSPSIEFGHNGGVQ